ncbi:MAG: AAA family ATPase [Gammaproteobacteria bacterium]|nr:AAA family ATPase [Gammaproteobacteria bacterium]
MTSRLGKPDTKADLTLRVRLSEEGTRHFIMIAGAGSGKTTSLIKALNYLKQSRGHQMQRQAQQIACITYTDKAVNEISGDVGQDPLFHVSTIHSFLWSVIKPFQSDLHAWVRQRLAEKIDEAQTKIDKPRVRPATIEKERAKIERYKHQLEVVDTVKQFTYGTGSDYAKGILGHSDILRLGPSLITKHALMRKVVAQRFPVIFVDESQDTEPDFVSALKALAESALPEFCLGFFGDPVQKIYMTGVGHIRPEENWISIEKPENFRCPVSVLNVINRIRAEADGLVQTGGRMIDQDGVLEAVQAARLFILPADNRRAERLVHVRTWLSEHNNDPLWQSDEEEGDVRMLVIVHRMAASRLGFQNIYSALNDKAPENLKSGLTDGTAWIVRPFIRYLLPLLKAHRSGDDFEVMTLLRQYCPRLQAERLTGHDMAAELASLKTDLVSLDDQLVVGSTVDIGTIISFAQTRELVELDERFLPVLTDYAEGDTFDNNAPENSPLRFMQCEAGELWGYQTYIEDQSPFATQQGIKGAEFDRVLVVVDDEENTNNSFSYGKYFGLTPLSKRDQANIDAGGETVVDRTRRLFYVCCSRAVKDLAVVIFTADVATVHAVVDAKGYFATDDIHLLDL